MSGGAESAPGSLGSSVQEVDITRTDSSMHDVRRLVAGDCEVAGEDPVHFRDDWTGPGGQQCGSATIGPADACHADHWRFLRGGSENLPHARIQLRVAGADAVAGLGQRPHCRHHAVGAQELGRLLDSRESHRSHRRQHEHPVFFAADVELSILDVGSGERLKVNEVEVYAACVQFPANRKRRVDRLAPAHAGLRRRDRVQHRHVAAMVSLAQHVTQPFHASQELAHVRPIGHAEVVAGRGPLPPASVRGVVEPVQGQEVLAHGEVGKGRVRQTLRCRTPSAAIESFEPCSRAKIEMGNRTGHFVLDYIAAKAWLVTARAAVPSLGAEVVAKLNDIAASASVIAPVDHAVLVMPVEYGTEEALLAECHHHIAIIQPHFAGARTDLGKKRR